MSTKNQQQKTLAILENNLNETSGRVAAVWGKEIWGPETYDTVTVLRLFIEASACFQTRALEEAVEAANGTPGSPGAVDVFRLHKPTLERPQGHLSIKKTHALDPKFLPHMSRAIINLWTGKERADRFNISNLQETLLFAFGDRVTKCDYDKRLREGRVTLHVPYEKIDSLGNGSKDILAQIPEVMHSSISPHIANKMFLGSREETSPPSGVDIFFNPAYADEFSREWHSLENKSTPKAIQEQLKL